LVLALSIVVEAPLKPARSLDSEAASGWKFSASLRNSAPTLMAIPSLASGDLTPYLPSSPVILPETMRSLTKPPSVAGVASDAAWAAVTPPWVKICHGMHDLPPVRQVPPGPTLRALLMAL